MTDDEAARLAQYQALLRVDLIRKLNVLGGIAQQGAANWQVLASSISLFIKLADVLSPDDLAEMTKLMLRLTEAILPRDMEGIGIAAKEFFELAQLFVEKYTIPRV